MNHLNAWSTRVHEHSTNHKIGITAAEAVDWFGKPPSSCTSGQLLNAAARDGWFRREKICDDSGRELNRYRYFSIDKQAAPSRRHNPAQSWFHGVKRVRSIFELGDSL